MRPFETGDLVAVAVRLLNIPIERAIERANLVAVEALLRRIQQLPDPFEAGAEMLAGLIHADVFDDDVIAVALLATAQMLAMRDIRDTLGEAELLAASRAVNVDAPNEAIAGLLRAAATSSDSDPQASVISPRIVSSRVTRLDAHRLPGYLDTGGYVGLRRAVLELTPSDVREEIRSSKLTGRSGGAAFPTAAKWDTLVPGASRYLVVNGDESEPGFFKDRLLMTTDPHQLIEGSLLCAYAIGARLIVIYVRGEMAEALEHLIGALNEAYEYGAVGRAIFGSSYSCDVIVHAGAGAYVVGEETALLESLEGRRGFPRIKPPYFPSVRGLYGEPTIVNNVETLSTLPWIVRYGGVAYAALGGGRFRGTRLFCLSGRINRPGTYEVELHRLTFRDLLFHDDLGAGIPDGGELRAFIPGASFPWFFPEQLELHLDGDEVAEHGSSLGSGVMVLDQTICPVRVAWRLARFFARESCGQCTPCREGTNWLTTILERIERGEGRLEDLELLLDVGDGISPEPFPHPERLEIGIPAVPFPYLQTTICPLGPSAVSAVESSIWRFRDDYLEHIRTRACPYRRVGALTGVS